MIAMPQNLRCAIYLKKLKHDGSKSVQAYLGIVTHSPFSILHSPLQLNNNPHTRQHRAIGIRDEVG
jgi:hypothetical protein